MRIGLTFLAIVFVPAAASADYAAPAWYDILAASDLIVVGTIEKVEDKTFTLTVERHIAGELEGSTARINRFQDWECASRWSAYRKGTRVMVFADHIPNREDKSGSPWVIRSAGGEGEMPVVDDDVILQLSLGADPKSQRHLIDGTHVYGQRVALDRVTRLIERVRECYTIDRERNGSQWPRVVGGERTCTDRKLEQWKADDPLFAAVAAQATSRFPEDAR